MVFCGSTHVVQQKWVSTALKQPLANLKRPVVSGLHEGCLSTDCCGVYVKCALTVSKQKFYGSLVSNFGCVVQRSAAKAVSVVEVWGVFVNSV